MAQSFLSACYELGWGVRLDYVAAYKRYNLAAVTHS